MTGFDELYGEYDPEEEFILSAEDVKLLLDHMGGEIINMDELNSLLQDMDDFVGVFFDTKDESVP